MSKTLTKEERIKANKDLIRMIREEIIQGGLSLENALDDWTDTTNLERLVLRLCAIEDSNFDYLTDRLEELFKLYKEIKDLKLKLKDHRHLPNGEVVTPLE